MKKVKLTVNGMFCAHCSKTVEDTLSNLGVTASVDLAANKVFIKYDETKISLERMQRALKKAGYDLVIEEKNNNYQLIAMIFGIVLTLPLFYSMFAHIGLSKIVPNIFMNSIFQLVLASLVQIIIGSLFYKRAFYQIKAKNLGMDVLVSLATTAAFLLSIYNMFNSGILYFEASAMVLCVVNIGHYIANSVKKKTGKALQELTKLQVKEAEVITKKGLVLTPIEQVEVDDIVIVKIGEKIPLDGIIIEGETSIDESLISGESRTVKKSKDDYVYAGSINIESKITIKVCKDMDDSLLGQIIEQINLSSVNKPHLQKISDSIAKVFVPVVCGLSVISLLINYFLLNNPIDISIIRSVSVLVVSCPCALGLAVPMSILVGYSLAAKKGVLFKNGESFETLHHIQAVAFDKTGTLSYGKLKIKAVYGDKRLLSLVKYMESSSTHPIATSLCNEIKEIGDYSFNVKEIPGKCMIGKEENNNYALGSRYVLKDIELEIDQKDFISKYKTSNLIFLVKNNELVLILALDDIVKGSSIEAIEGLHNKNIETYMITGDKKDIALETATLLKIPHECVYYEVSPLDKANIIKDIQSKGLKVAFVGDGVNDALALQTSDLGIAVRTGSDIAILASDVTLLNSNLNSVYKTIKISELIYNNIIQNFIWALCYNIVMIPLAILGIVSPIISGAAMALSNILVVLNALRLYLKKETK